MLFAVNIILIGDNRQKVNQWLNMWRLALEGKELRIKRSKTYYIEYEFGEREEVDETRRLNDNKW